jgi:hypothetical protein
LRSHETSVHKITRIKQTSAALTVLTTSCAGRRLKEKISGFGERASCPPPDGLAVASLWGQQASCPLFSPGGRGLAREAPALQFVVRAMENL